MLFLLQNGCSFDPTELCIQLKANEDHAIEVLTNRYQTPPIDAKQIYKEIDLEDTRNRTALFQLQRECFAVNPKYPILLSQFIIQLKTHIEATKAHITNVLQSILLQDIIEYILHPYV